jgi:hypothetical protein
MTHRVMNLLKGFELLVSRDKLSLAGGARCCGSIEERTAWIGKSHAVRVPDAKPDGSLAHMTKAEKGQMRALRSLHKTGAFVWQFSRSLFFEAWSFSRSSD